MKMKIGALLLVVGLAVGLAACTGGQAASVNATPQADQAPAQQSQQQAQAQGQPGQPGDMPLEGRLAIGTLSLEGTENAVTAEQARELLPLWKAVKTLSASDTTSPEEMSAVYQQIQDAMTEQQIQALKELSIKPEDTQALMQKYGIEAPQIDPSRLATRAAGAAQSGQSGQAGTGGFQGVPGGGMGMGGPPAGMPASEFPGGQMPAAQGTPQPGRTPRAGGFRGGMGGMNTLFVEPLIKLLEERAGG